MTNHVHLSKGEKRRQAVYRELFRYQLDPGMIGEFVLRKTTRPGLCRGRWVTGAAIAKMVCPLFARAL
ncbi:MAG: hypothetical protein GY792_30505 [Gammaproteobacteria bacterium]|nr:hypothetical protein [Gammaproteobacteria bacterium]